MKIVYYLELSCNFEVRNLIGGLIKNTRVKITILLFGIATDLIGSSSLVVALPINSNVSSLKNFLKEQHPKLEKMSAYAVAINECYVTDETIIQENDVIAIIPPVSGG
jgi:molybdopterin converting factor subunit 1